MLSVTQQYQFNIIGLKAITKTTVLSLVFFGKQKNIGMIGVNIVNRKTITLK